MLGYRPPPPSLLSELITKRIALHNLLKKVANDHPEALKIKDELVVLMDRATPQEKDAFMASFLEWRYDDDVNEAHKVAEDLKRKTDEENRHAGCLKMKF
jgi:hypothetical protein